MSAGKEGVIACLLLALLVSSVFIEVCRGEVWFEGEDSTEKPQGISVDLNPQLPFPSCQLNLTETEPHTVNLTITITTWTWYLQTKNFDTWLSIDSQESEKLPEGNLSHDEGTMLGYMWSRQYNVTIDGLSNGNHSINIRVDGEYHQNASNSGWSKFGESGYNYSWTSNVDFTVNSTAVTSTPLTQTQVFVVGTALVFTIIAGIAIAVLYKRKRISLLRQPAPKQQEV